MNTGQTQKLIVSNADITSSCRMINKQGSYMLLPRANRVEHNLPGFEGVQAQVLAAPQLGAKFVEHELLVHPNGKTSKPVEQAYEQFIYVLEGKLQFELDGKKYNYGRGWLLLVASIPCVSIQERSGPIDPFSLGAPQIRSC